MEKLGIIKGVASIVTGLGVGKTVDIILKNQLPIEMDWKTRIATFIGTAAISGYISAKCSEHVEEEIDNIAEMVDKIKQGDAVQTIIVNEQQVAEATV